MRAATAGRPPANSLTAVMGVRLDAAHVYHRKFVFYTSCVIFWAADVEWSKPRTSTCIVRNVIFKPMGNDEKIVAESFCLRRCWSKKARRVI
jgi:hypothetical protein